MCDLCVTRTKQVLGFEMVIVEMAIVPLTYAFFVVGTMVDALTTK